MATSSPRTESERTVRSRSRNSVSSRRAPLAALALVLFAALMAREAGAGEDQDFEDFFGSYTHRVEGVTVGAGDAPASNTAAQIIDPWPVYSQDRQIRSESQRMIGAIRRYHTNSAAKSLSAQDTDPAGPDAQADPAAAPAAKTPPSATDSAAE
jgi:hypothetical protein